MKIFFSNHMHGVPLGRGKTQTARCRAGPGRVVDVRGRDSLPGFYFQKKTLSQARIIYKTKRSF